MISVVEPLCDGPSHEKVNSGFLYALHLAFPEETLKFYANPRHIVAIKNIMASNETVLNSIEFNPVSFYRLPTIFGLGFNAYFLLRLFLDSLRSNSNKFFFLSFNAEILFLIKKLKLFDKFKKNKFIFVLHGAFESISSGHAIPIGVPLPVKAIHRVGSFWLAKKIFQDGLCNSIIRVWKKIYGLPLLNSWGPFHKFFSIKKILMYLPSGDYRYIALSPHIVKNASEYIDLSKIQIYPVLMPTIFSVPRCQASNAGVKFGIFGFGDSLVLHNILHLISKKKLSQPYEVRVIGMDNRGLEGFDNATCPGGGRVLDRLEMEEMAQDIDIFLILYDKTKYRLSCSASILESISLMKPILHFPNDSISYFNRKNQPIGISCSTLNDYVDKMSEIIENYDSYKSIFATYIENINVLRAECHIEKSAMELKKILSWTD
jgi:hypothetical protein